jgi:hypothetical protein
VLVVLSQVAIGLLLIPYFYLVFQKLFSNNSCLLQNILDSSLPLYDRQKNIQGMGEGEEHKVRGERSKWVVVTNNKGQSRCNKRKRRTFYFHLSTVEGYSRPMKDLISKLPCILGKSQGLLAKVFKNSF